MPTHYTVPADGTERTIHAERAQFLADAAAWNRYARRMNAKALAAGLVTATELARDRRASQAALARLQAQHEHSRKVSASVWAVRP